MPRPKGSKNKRNEELSEKRITLRLSERLLVQLDAVAKKQGQNRSEAALEALREYVRRG